MNVIAVGLLPVLTWLNGCDAADFTLTNRCGFTVWPGVLSGQQAEGFELRPGQSRVVSRGGGWSGRFWGRTGCSFDGAGNGRCVTGDCNGLNCRGGGVPPVTLAEFTLAGWGGQDYYDVSNVDGFNIPVSIKAQGGSGSCKETYCRTDINAICPDELKVWDNGRVVGCKSACLAFNREEYCCTGSHNQPETCPATDYSRFFKNACPAAYSYAYDDLTSTFTCSNANYAITFC